MAVVMLIANCFLFSGLGVALYIIIRLLIESLFDIGNFFDSKALWICLIITGVLIILSFLVMLGGATILIMFNKGG